MNLHATFEGLVDSFFQQRERFRVWRELRERRALRRQLRKDRTYFIPTKKIEPRCIVRNEREPH